MENNQREITPKIFKQELWSLTRHVISSCFISVPSFIEITLTIFELLSGHEIVWKIIKRKITHKILKPELWFLCMTHRLIMLNKCTKFH